MVVVRGELEHGACSYVVFKKTRSPPIPTVLDQRSTYVTDDVGRRIVGVSR